MCKQSFLKCLASRSMNNQKVNVQSNIILSGWSLYYTVKLSEISLFHQKFNLLFDIQHFG